MKTKTTLQTRRKFLRTSMLGAAASWTLPIFLEKTFFALDALAADAATQTVTGKDGTILVVLQMAGGNDGLNTVIPYADDAYHVARPRLRMAADQVLKIDNHERRCRCSCLDMVENVVFVNVRDDRKTWWRITRPAGGATGRRATRCAGSRSPPPRLTTWWRFCARLPTSDFWQTPP